MLDGARANSGEGLPESTRAVLAEGGQEGGASRFEPDGVVVSSYDGESASSKMRREKRAYLLRE